MLEKIRYSVHVINLLCGLFLMASLPFYFPKQQLALTLFFVSYIVEFLVDMKWRQIQISATTWYFIGILLFFTMGFLYYPFEDSHTYFHNLTERRLALFGFAIIGIFGYNSLYKLSYFLHTIIISSTLLILYLIIYHIGLPEFLTNENRYDLFTQARIAYVNSHMAFNLYLNIALASVWYLAVTRFKELHWSVKTIYGFSILLIISTLLMSEGRSGFIAAMGLSAIIVIRKIWLTKKIVAIGASVFIVIGMVFAVLQHERMSEKMIEQEPRLFLWTKVALPIIQEKPILGHGLSDGQTQIDSVRQGKQSKILYELWKTNKRVDVHNQFLQTTIEFGLIGLVLLLAIYYYPIRLVNRSRMTLLLLGLFLFSWQSLFDTFITGQFAIIFGFFITLLLTVPKSESLNNNQTALKNLW